VLLAKPVDAVTANCIRYLLRSKMNEHRHRLSTKVQLAALEMKAPRTQ
jgi:hypothetical protein